MKTICVFAGLTVSSASSVTPPRKPVFTPATSEVDLVKSLNGDFKGYSPTIKDSPLGTTITWLKDWDTKMNLYCGSVPGNDADGCYDASADCAMSAILHNHKFALNKAKNSVLSFSERTVGVILNQELVEQYYGKCSYTFDGASNFRYNHRCGAVASAEYLSCDSPEFSPYKNVCPSTGERCTADAVEVEGGSCDSCCDGHAPHRSVGQCFFKGPSYNVSATETFPHYNGEAMFDADHLRTMAHDRAMSEDIDCGDMCWNEVVIDERLLLTQLWWDPAVAVKGFVQVKGVAPEHAKQLQASFERDWGVQLPIISVDVECNVDDTSCGPFYPTTLPQCTGTDEDPYAFGEEIACCEGLEKKLNNWDGDVHWYYRCVATVVHV